jgi:hypothetical protein
MHASYEGKTVNIVLKVLTNIIKTKGKILVEINIVLRQYVIYLKKKNFKLLRV